MSNPCRYCVPPKRTPTCHCDCPEWLEFKAEQNAKKEAERKERMKEVYFNEQVRKRVTNSVKYKKRKSERKMRIQ